MDKFYKAQTPFYHPGQLLTNCYTTGTAANEGDELPAGV